jgi:hypothetical protein
MQTTHNILNVSAIQSWMNMNNIHTLLPTTMVPLGVLVRSVGQYMQLPSELLTGDILYRYFSDVIGPKYFRKYLKLKHINIDDLNTDTKFPYAMIMGPDVFIQTYFPTQPVFR